jgi:hypothetical protein
VTGFEPIHRKVRQDVEVKAVDKSEQPAVFFECVVPAATLVPIIRSPFDFLAEGLVSKNSRGGKTPLELFLAGVRDWEAGLRRFVVRELDSN